MLKSFWLINLSCVFSAIILYIKDLIFLNQQVDKLVYFSQFSIYQFIYSILIFLFITSLPLIILKFLLNIYRPKNYEFVNKNFFKKYFLKLFNKKNIYIYLVFYILIASCARFYKIDIAYNVEEKVNGVLRHFIYYGYKMIIPTMVLLTLIKSYMNINIKDFIFIMLSCLLVSALTNSRISIVLLLFPIAFLLIYKNIVRSLHKIHIYIFIVFFCIFIFNLLFVSATLFRGYFNYNLINFPEDSVLDNIILTFDHVTFSIFKYDEITDRGLKNYEFFTIILDRLSTYQDFLLYYKLNYVKIDIIKIILFKIFNISMFDVYYNSILETLFNNKNLEPGTMMGLSPAGFLLLIANKSLFSLIITIFILLLIYSSIYFSVKIISMFLGLVNIDESFIALYLYIMWLWVQPKVSLFIILFSFIFYFVNYFICLLKYKIENLKKIY